MVIRVGDRYALASCDYDSGYRASANRELTPVRVRARGIDYRVIEWTCVRMCARVPRMCVRVACSCGVRGDRQLTASLRVWPTWRPGGARSPVTEVARLPVAGIRSISSRRNTHTGFQRRPADGRAERVDERPSAAAAAAAAQTLQL